MRPRGRDAIFTGRTNRTEAFVSTNINLNPETIVEYFVLRWNLEVTFEEARMHLGVETQRQWSELAIKRTTPILFGLFSIICLIAYRQNQQESDLVKACSTAWYDKEDNATFSDVITYVKRLIIISLLLMMSLLKFDGWIWIY